MSAHNDGGPAFPQMDAFVNAAGEKPVYVAAGGMTLRDYIAAKAMQALLHPQHFVALSELSSDESHVARLAKEAYWTADAMLAARGEA